MPVKIKELTEIKIVAAGNWHTMALDSKGCIFATGNNSHGELGLGHFDKVSGFTKTEIKEISKISCGDGYSLLVN